MYNIEDTLLIQTFHELAEQSFRLQKLERLAVRNEIAPRTDFGFQLSDIAPFLRSPALQTVMVHVGDNSHPEYSDTKFKLPHSSSITRLVVNHGAL